MSVCLSIRVYLSVRRVSSSLRRHFFTDGKLLSISRGNIATNNNYSPYVNGNRKIRGGGGGARGGNRRRGRLQMRLMATVGVAVGSLAPHTGRGKVFPENRDRRISRRVGNENTNEFRGADGPTKYYRRNIVYAPVIIIRITFEVTQNRQRGFPSKS